MTVPLLVLSLVSVQASATALLCKDLHHSAPSPASNFESSVSQGPLRNEEIKEPWFRKIKFSDVEATLQKGKIISIQDLKSALEESGKKPSGTTLGMKLVTFEDGTQAVWKPGAKNLTEVAAYRAARAVGSRLIPPTVARKMDIASFDSSLHEAVSKLIGVEGSLQFFVRTPFDLLKFSSSERVAIWQKVPKSQKAQRDIFNFVFGNWDLHWGNLLIDGSYSIVQIDNGAIRSRHKVRYGELPFIRRISFSDEGRKAFHGMKEGAFPFDDTIYLVKPSLLEIIAAVRNYAKPEGLAEHIKSRLKSFNNPHMTAEEVEQVAEQFADLIRQKSSQSVLEAFVRDHLQGFTPKDLTMRIAFWDNAIWIQAIGFQNYNPIVPPVFSAEVLAGYRDLTYVQLRSIFPNNDFSDQAIYEMLERRDQILAADEKAGVEP